MKGFSSIKNRQANIKTKIKLTAKKKQLNHFEVDDFSSSEKVRSDEKFLMELNETFSEMTLKRNEEESSSFIAKFCNFITF